MAVLFTCAVLTLTDAMGSDYLEMVSLEGVAVAAGPRRHSLTPILSALLMWTHARAAAVVMMMISRWP